MVVQVQAPAEPQWFAFQTDVSLRTPATVGTSRMVCLATYCLRWRRSGLPGWFPLMRSLSFAGRAIYQAC